MKRAGSFLFLPAALAIPSISAAQPVEIGQRAVVPSEILHEDRGLIIALPESYQTSSFRYPVLYLLDADSDFQHTAAIVEFLSRTDQVPELIVVGITNTNRSRDLTPPSGDDDETAFWDEVGGADEFRRFLAEELIPFVDEEFRTAPYRIIRGQSFGGLFSIYDYMSETPIFHAYLTSSPAVGWNFDELIDRVPQDFAERERRGRPLLYVASGGRDFPGNLSAIRRFGAAMKQARSKSAAVRWRHDHFEEERHYSVVLPATIAGLRFLYAGWQPPPAVEQQADFTAYEAHYAGLSEELGYEIRIPLQTVIRLGNQLLREKRYDEGIRVLRRNLDLYPEQPESHWHVGDAYVLAGRDAEARPYFQRAYELARGLGLPDLADYEASLGS